MKQGTRRQFITKVGMGVGTIGLMAQAPAALGQGGTDGNPIPTTPPTNQHVQHLRKDARELGEMGNGKIEIGMNKLGEMGYQLFSVTTIGNTGEGGFHLFKRQPWDPGNLPLSRPKFEFKCISDSDLTQIGEGDFNKGIATLEKESWEVVAATELSNGSVAFYYLQRIKK